MKRVWLIQALFFNTPGGDMNRLTLVCNVTNSGEEWFVVLPDNSPRPVSGPFHLRADAECERERLERIRAVLMNNQPQTESDRETADPR